MKAHYNCLNNTWPMDNRGIQSLLLVIRHMGGKLKLGRVMQYKWD